MTPVSYIQYAEQNAALSIGADGSFSGGNRLIAGDAVRDLKTHAARQIAARFVAARRAAVVLDSYPGLLPDSLPQAYSCQEFAIDLWPDRIGGWKVARISEGWQKIHPSGRLTGPVFQRNIQFAATGQTVDCPVFAGGLAAVEAELVIRIGRDAPPDEVHWSLEEAAALIGTLHIGVEVASSPLAALNDLGPAAVISDFGNNWGVIAGSTIDDWKALRTVAAETHVDDERVGSATTGIEDGPLSALKFALASCAERGRPLKAGQLISTGAITGVHDVLIGQYSRHVFAGLGEVCCRIVAAQPFSGPP